MNDLDQGHQLERTFPCSEVPSQVEPTQLPVTEQGSNQHDHLPQTTTCRHPLGREQCPSHSNTRVGSPPGPGTDVHGVDRRQSRPNHLPIDAPSTPARPERSVRHSPALEEYIQNPLRHEQLNFSESASHAGGGGDLPYLNGGSDGHRVGREPSQDHEDTRGVGSWCDHSS